MFIVVYRLALIINMTVVNLIVEVIVGIIVYLLGIILLKAPIVNQAIKLIQNRRLEKDRIKVYLLTYYIVKGKRNYAIFNFCY